MADDLESDQQAGPSSCEQVEWETLKSARLKEGYREGVGAGEDVSMQDGFNCGFDVGLRLVQNIAYLRGILWVAINSKLAEATEDGPSLMQELVNMEKTLLKATQEARHEKEEEPPAAVLPETMSMRLEEIKTICSNLQEKLKEQPKFQ